MENLQKVKNYESRFRDTAEKLELKYKIPALLILGVGALESGSRTELIQGNSSVQAGADRCQPGRPCL